MSEESKIGTTKRAFCAACKGERNCEIKGHHRETYSDEHFDWWKDWYLLVCRGCDHVFALSEASDSESTYPVGQDRNGEFEYHQDVQTSSWPAKFKRARPEWLDRLVGLVEHDRSDDLESCLFQVYEALDHDLNILAAIGIRTTFDVASEILGVDPDQPFEQKLTSMESDGQITPSQRDDFEVLINAGNASAHRGWNPSFQDLDPLVDSLEHFISDKFVTPHLRKKTADGVAKLRSKVPQRVKKGRAKKKLQSPAT
ncbi:DUF4145 domain-containing protein [Mesorhizobium captivum]|uniref:DUF4145 domain-containing protein n=1 Tax=Mesorhizobium captivum TaxID=3072319 RepID=UPI002A245B48|nr:DUF4145 domain-containing protein [Mesorhizobium sp. VK3C]MDX8449254.1 DUF4145 domain-containing protein [Mesorhizobium sp. VK3C]